MFIHVVIRRSCTSFRLSSTSDFSNAASTPRKLRLCLMFDVKCNVFSQISYITSSDWQAKLNVSKYTVKEIN